MVSGPSACHGLSKAVVHRILTTLVAKGFLETEPGTRRYRLTRHHAVSLFQMVSCGRKGRSHV
jgi:DNA-binding IclR family transcriptional regulator